MRHAPLLFNAVVQPETRSSFGLLRVSACVAGLWGLLSGFECVVPAQAAETLPEWTSSQLEHFEKQVRPLLAEHCQKCHGAEKQEGGLRLDSREFLLRGGDTGPAIVPGQPEASEMILAISHDPAGYQMPPSGKLSEFQIATLTAWVREQAPWPAEVAPVDSVSNTRQAVLARRHWSLEPITDPPVPAIESTGVDLSPVDAFIRAEWAERGLKAAPPASRETLLRRACFGLLGLPPTAAQRDQFLNDPSPAALDQLLDELLASPHYGERWGRHWLDLVRFSETLGHEFDYEIPLAWKYRDYVIRALNADVPMDQFVREHLAGDQLAEPRRHPETGANESVLGTGFFWFGQGKHSPVDIRAEQCDLLENQIDVLTKTFLGTTVACARCHDHKFDAITIDDYYALAGIMESSRRHYADLRPGEPLAQTIAAIDRLKQSRRRDLLNIAATHLRELLEGAVNLPDIIPADSPGIDRLEHPLHAWKVLKEHSDPAEFARQSAALRQRMLARNQQVEGARSSSQTLVSFENGLPADWQRTGTAFACPPVEGDFLCGPNPWKPVESLVAGPVVHSGLASGRAAGTLRSPTFVITAPFLDYHLCRSEGKRLSAELNRGPLKQGQVHLIIDGFQHTRSPIYGGLSFEAPLANQPVWHRQDVRKWIGHRAYIEILDEEDGCLQLDEIRLSEQGSPLEPVAAETVELLSQPEFSDAARWQTALRTYFDHCISALEAAASSPQASLETLSAGQLQILNALLRLVHHDSRPMSAPAWLDAFYVEFKQRENELGTPQFGLTTIDGSPLNAPLLIRGNPGKPAAEVPRRYLAALGGSHDQIPPEQSGRLQLAEWIVAPENPLFDRVLVNRVWKYHFGRGLVGSPDDFGHMGQLPTHPELLDYLASRFREHGRSLKWLHRTLLTSATWQQSSDLSADSTGVDPDNRYWSRMPVLRLEGEAIRDSLLAISGQLRPELFGPSVPVHLTPFMQGRGRPGSSGPLDGGGRRSIYLSVRRNFLSPLFLAFDYPLPLTTAGRRSVSNVPAQALTLMNNEFAIQQAGYWADKLLAATPDSAPAARVEQAYLQAYGRRPTEREQSTAVQFVNDELAAGRAARDVWADLCHVLINVKEFVFIR